ncbi:MAG: GNAT family N-acetyltransferase [Planctomycetota bacterium]
MTDVRVNLEHELPQSGQDQIWKGLREFTESIAGPKNNQPLHVVARAPDGAILGGLIGASAWGWLFIDGLWVEAPHRNAGLGSRLMALAEEEGRKRGCYGAMLETFSFEARPFYEKLGYQVHSVLQNQPPGHQRLGLHKVFPGT